MMEESGRRGKKKNGMVKSKKIKLKGNWREKTGNYREGIGGKIQWGKIK